MENKVSMADDEYDIEQSEDNMFLKKVKVPSSNESRIVKKPPMNYFPPYFFSAHDF